MAVKATESKSAAVKPAEVKAKAPGECVVDDGTMHVGRAVNGLVCSYHANRYDAQGRRRPA